jgi:hypothetical protein
VQHHRALLLHRQNGLTCLSKAVGGHHHHLGDPLTERTLHGAAHLGLGWAESFAQERWNASCRAAVKAEAKTLANGPSNP